MEIAVPDASYPENEWNEAARQDFLRELDVELKTLSDEYTLTDTDIGRGADWPAILASVTIAATIFFSGKRVEENLDAWISLANRLRTFVDTATAKWRAARVDQDGASLLALDEVTRRYPQAVRVLRLDGVLSSWFDPLDAHMKSADHLDHHPEALYVVALEVDEEALYIVGVKSSGVIEFVHVFSTDWMDF